MMDVAQQVNSVRRAVGTRVLEAGEARTVTVSRRYDATVEEVWDACTNPELEHIAQVAEEIWDQFGPGAVGVGWA